MSFTRSGSLVMMLLLLSALCFGQQDNASLLGTVTDSSGGVIPGATVTIQNQGTAQTVVLTTDANGNFIAPVLPIGLYRVTVTLKGFKTNFREGVQLRQADRMKIDVALEAGDISEKITVTGEVGLVETASTTLGGTVGQQQVAELPLNGRSLASLIGLAPGVQMLGTAQQRSMNGVSQTRLFESGSRLLVDGGDSGQVDSDIIDSAYASQARVTRASVDAIAEIRIQESAFSAEYGQAMGGVVNFITKSGTNNFHGTLFEYFRNEKLDARNYFNAPPALKPPFRLNQFGGTIGGPIIRDKLFFFANYEGVRQRLGLFQNVFVPTLAFRNTLPAAVRAEADLLPLPNGDPSPTEPRLARFTRGISNSLTEDTGSGKLDYLLSSNDRITMRYNRNVSTTQSWFGVGDNQFRLVPSTLQLAKVTYTKTITPSLLNEAGFALNRAEWYAASGGTPEFRNTPVIGTFAGMAAIGPTALDLPVANTSFTFLDTLSWIKGRHAIKAGFQIVRNRDNKAILFQRSAVFQTLDQFAANRPFQLLTSGQPRMGMRNTYNHFFVQDDIQATKNLTLNLGVRYQYDTTPTESHGRIANFVPALGGIEPVGTELYPAPKLNIAPRIGIAYTPFGLKSTVIRTGYGIYHSAIVAAAAQQIPGNIPGISQALTIVNPAFGAFPFPANLGLNATIPLYSFPKDFKTSYTQHWNFNIQQGIGQSAVWQVGYLGNRQVHLSPFQELNRINPVTRVRKYPQFATITSFFNGANANYHAFQTSFKKRMTRGLTFNVNYTYSHAIDQGGVSNGAASTLVQDDQNLRLERASADYDVRHYLQFDYTYQLPGVPMIPKVIGSGWQVNGLTVMRAGLPFNVVCGCDPVGIGASTGRPDLVPGVDPVPQGSAFDYPNNQLNAAAFRTPVGRWGTLGRNVFTGPPAYNWDFSLFKNFKIRESQQIQFRAEVFNLFNHPQFSNPGSTTAAPATFGRSLTTMPAVGGFASNRQVQFALRYGF